MRKKEEQRIAEEEEQKKVDYRMQMAKALMEERQAEWDEATNRDHELLSMMREDSLDEVYQEWLLWEVLIFESYSPYRHVGQLRLTVLLDCILVQSV